jgi:hypothetical protein
MINLRLVLLILAFVLFAIAAFNTTSRVNLVAAGLAVWVLSMVTTAP